ncbi:MAG: DUF2723 domain-containing protein [Bacteroidota bacterium]
MNVNWKLTERIVATVVFVWALVLYLLTVAPTASFWDSGEFIAIANRLQVSHPPGAPFYMLVGRFFSMFVPTEYISLAVNLVSVFASAFTVLLTHLIIVRIAREWAGKTPSFHTKITILAGGFIGALTFAATDSFWFNAVEAEVYALSMFFTAIVVWLIMKWSELARQEEQITSGKQHPFGLSANRYLVLIAYLFGLAIGVHLLNLLAIFFIALIFYFTEFYRDGVDRQTMILGILLTGAVSTLSFLAIYPGIITWLPGFVGSSFSPTLTLVFIVAAIVFGVYFTHMRNMQVTNLVFLCIAVVFIGYSSYALIFIRSASNPPIDENDPEDAESIVSYLKREQYGSTPLLTGNTFDNATQQIDPNEEVLFPRRHSPTPLHMRYYAQFDSDSEYFWKYQVNNMYFRYFLWNFVGRASDIQDAPAITGISFIDPPEYSADRYVQSPSEKHSRNVYFALPLLLGLFGGVYHFRRDWKRAFSVFVLFFVTGIGIILYLNQTPYQPRERDYSYVASFFAFSIWVGIGATGVLQLALEALTSKEGRSSGMISNALYGIAALLFLSVPLWMTIQNYKDHDRSGRYVAPEYAYNMLMSVEDDAILITNGDNDTFPLWYLQEVEGERQDVRVVNISLLNTPWYIKQLKNQYSRDSAPLPISMSDEHIENLEIMPWKPDQLSLPVDIEGMLGGNEVPIAIEDTSLLESPMTWQLNGRPYSDQFNLLYISDQALLDMLITNARNGWQRPFYYAVTVSQDGQLDLENYFQLEGQAFRVVPIKHNELLGRAIPSITAENLKKFKLTNLNNPDVYYDENIRRMVDNYRNVFVQTAQTMFMQGDRAGAVELLDFLMEKIPYEVIPGTERSHLIVARAFQLAGEKEKAVDIWQKAEPLVLENLTRAQTQTTLDQTARFMQMMQIGYMEVGDYEAAAAFTNKIAEAIGDESYRRTAAEFEADSKRLFSAPASDTAAGN